MTATILAGLLGAVLGIVAGAMALDAYHERLRKIYEEAATDAEAKRHATAGELYAVRQQLARSEALVESLSIEIARLTLTEAARWN